MEKARAHGRTFSNFFVAANSALTTPTFTTATILRKMGKSKLRGWSYLAIFDAPRTNTSQTSIPNPSSTLRQARAKTSAQTLIFLMSKRM